MPRNKKNRILWVSEGLRAPNSIKNLSERLIQKLRGSGNSSYEIYTCELGDLEALERAFLRFGPDVVIALGDIEKLQYLSGLKIQGVPLILGCGLRSKILNKDITGILPKASRIVSFSTCLKGFLCNIDPSIPVVTILNGIDSDAFCPMDKVTVRTENHLEDRFIVGYVGPNDLYSNIGILMKAFHQFSVDKREALLLLHTAVIGQGANIDSLSKFYGLEQKCAISQGIDSEPSWGDTDLSSLYNLFDVMVVPSMGDAFPDPIMEAMSCGVPVIGTKCPSVVELLEGRGELIDIKDWIYSGPLNYELTVPDTNHLVYLLNRLYRDSQYRMHLSRTGRLYAEAATWDRCLVKWEEIIHEAIATSPAHSVSREISILLSSSTVSSTAWKKGPLNIEPFARMVPASEWRNPPVLPTFQKDDEIKLVWRSPAYDSSGYADESRSFINPLSRRLQNLRLDDQDWQSAPIPLNQDERITLERLRKTSFFPPFIEIVNQMPSILQENELAYHRIGRTMFEFQYLPEFWVEQCNGMDEVWVPSLFCKGLFEESGVLPEKLRLIPGPIDTKSFSPPKEKDTRENAKFRFLAVMTFIRRKGWDLLLEAFAREFRDSDPVELVVHTAHPQKSIHQIADEMYKRLKSFGISEAQMPKITLLHDKVLSRYQMRDLYLSADVFVLPTRGEGYGRPLLEALSCGVPVVTTAWGGQTDFVTKENGWLIDYKMAKATRCENPEFQRMNWAEPSLEHLRHCMREAVDNPQQRKEKGEKAPVSVSAYDQ